MLTELSSKKGAATENSTFLLYLLYMLYNRITLYKLSLYEQPNWADVLKTRRGDVPAARAGRLPAHLQGDVVPPIREQDRKSLTGMDTFDPQQAAWGADRRLPGQVTESEQLSFPML